MELVIKEKARGNFLWAAACGMFGLVVGPFHLIGLLVCAGAAILAARGFLAAGGKEYLKVDSEGFTVKSLFREKRVPWSDIEAFKVLTYRYLGLIPFRRQVVYRFVADRRKGAMKKAVGWINGWDEMLPSNYGMKARVLAGLMEECRGKAATTPGMYPGFKNV